MVEGEVTPKNPIRAIFVGCWASATAPTTTSTKAIDESANHFGFSILDFGLSAEELTGTLDCFLFMPLLVKTNLPPQ
jgi:hypothetical protein